MIRGKGEAGGASGPASGFTDWRVSFTYDGVTMIRRSYAIGIRLKPAAELIRDTSLDYTRQTMLLLPSARFDGTDGDDKAARKARHVKTRDRGNSVSVDRATGQIFSKRRLLIVRGFVCARENRQFPPLSPISINPRATSEQIFRPSPTTSLPRPSLSLSLPPPTPATYARANRRFFHEIGIVDQAESFTLFDPEAPQSVTRRPGIYRRLRRICRRSPSKNLSATRR